MATYFDEVYADEDTYIVKQNPSLNAGNLSYLILQFGQGGDSQCNILLKFSIPSGTLLNATLQLYVKNYTDMGTFRIRQVERNWSGGTVTWGNYSQVNVGTGEKQQSSAFPTKNAYWDIDITNVVGASAGQDIALLIYPTSAEINLTLGSREAGQYPKLKLEYEEVITPGKGVLNLTSLPTGATVYDNDVVIGNTPFSGELTAGSHDMRLSLSGFQDYAWLQTINDQETHAFHHDLVPLLPTTGTVNVTTDPTNCAVHIDNITVGYSPWSGEVEEGTHEFRVNTGGYYAQMWQETIVAGQTHNIHRVLDPAAVAQGTVTITSTPDGAAFYVDNAFIGNTSWSGLVDAGTHTFKLTAAGHEDEVFSYTVVDGGTHTIHKDLTLIDVGYVYKQLPEPPVDFPTAFIPIYQQLDIYADANDTEDFMSYLKTHAWDTASPAPFLMVFFAVFGVVSTVVGFLGSYIIAHFLFEEALQALDMTYWEMQTQKQWDLADAALAKKREFLEAGIWTDFTTYIPMLNVVKAVEKYKEVAMFKLIIDETMVQRKIDKVVKPDPGDISMWADAYNQGLPTDPYLPKAPAILKVNVNAPAGTIVVNKLGYSTMFPFEIQLPAGTYTVEVAAEGKISEARSVTLNPYDDKTVDFYLTKAEELPPDTGTITVNSTPPQARIYVDHEFKWEFTDTTFTVEVGSHTLTVKLYGYKDHTEIFTIAKDETKTFDIDLLLIGIPEDTGSLNVASSPAGAKIYKDGVFMWEYTDTMITVPVGTYTFTIKLKDYKDVSKDFTIEKDTVKTWYETLESTLPEVKEETGLVSISSEPVGAKIYELGEFMFEYTNTTLVLPVGEYYFTLKKVGYEEVSKTITIEKDVVKTWHVDMLSTVVEDYVTITIYSLPTEARIYIDDEFIYEFTNTTIRAPAGAHHITLKQTGYRDIKINYDWSAGTVKAIQATFALGYGGEDIVEIPADEVTIPLEPTAPDVRNAWEVTIKGVDSRTGEPVAAWILVDDDFVGHTTPAIVYLLAESTFNIKLRAKGYRQGEIDYTTPALPTV